MGRLLQMGVALAVLAVAVGQARASDAEDLVEQMYELDEFLKEETRVASQKAFTARESPGVVTLINEDDIRRSGARNLMDLLMRVPGFGLGVDVQAVVGPGVRGVWGHEGKVLLLVDGQEFNELMFATVQHGLSMPLEQVQRVEIIRGPGSAIYGGFAELAVIKVTTRAGNGFEGLSIAGTWGQTARTYGRRNLSASYGTRLGDLEVGLSALVGQSKLSDRTFTDFYDGSFDMADANVDPKQFNLSLGWKGLKVRFLMDDTVGTHGDAFGEVLKAPELLGFRSYFAEASYETELTEGVRLTSRLNYKHQSPWNNPNAALDPVTDYNFYDKFVQRYTGRVAATWEVTDAISLMVGTEGTYDRADASLMPPERHFGGTDRVVEYFSGAALTEGTFETAWVNITAGARFEAHNQFGTAFVPRLALTKAFDRFHFKLLGARAFRAPGIENFSLTPEIKPELTDVLELEVGYQLTRSMLITANVFDITIRRPIIYFYDPVEEIEGYANMGETGSRGAELEFHYRGDLGTAVLGYSFYTTAGKPLAETYQVAGRDDVALGFPAHKLTLSGSARVTDDLSINPSVIFLSRRFGNLSVDENDEPVVDEVPPALVLNLFVMYDNAFTPGLSIGAGVHDLLDQGPVLIQPYYGWHAPLPGASREFQLRVSYTL